MHRWTLVAFLALFATAAFVPSGDSNRAGWDTTASPWATAVACPVTHPNGNNPPEFGETQPPQEYTGYDGGYGNAALWTNMWMWGEGEVPVPSSHVRPDGSFGEMKWAWYRYVPGRLTIEGRRLDASAPPLRAWIPEGYGDIGFQVAGIIFPTAGCWEVTGRVGEATLTFVTRVIPPSSGRQPIIPLASPSLSPVPLAPA